MSVYNAQRGSSGIFEGCREHIVLTTISNAIRDDEILNDTDDMGPDVWGKLGGQTEIYSCLFVAAWAGSKIGDKGERKALIEFLTKMYHESIDVSVFL